VSAGQQTRIRESYLEKNRTHDEIQRGGSIGNLTDGIPTRLIACPGAGLAAAWPPLPNWTCTWRRSITRMESSPAAGSPSLAKAARKFADNEESATK